MNLSTTTRQKKLLNMKRFLVAIVSLILLAQFSTAQDVGSGDASSDPSHTPAIESAPEIQPVATNSPRRTVESLFRLRDELEVAITDYGLERTKRNADHIVFLFEQLTYLIDLSAVAPVSRQEIGTEIGLYLLDILGREPKVNVADVPDVETFDSKELDYYRLPGTPIRIKAMEGGPRTGEFLFSGAMGAIAPRYFAGISHLPLRTSANFSSWINTGQQISGPLIPNWFVTRIPEVLKQNFLDTPIWKSLLVLAILTSAMLALIVWQHLLKGMKSTRESTVLRLRTLGLFALLAVTLILKNFFAFQINFSGRMFEVVGFSTVLVVFLVTTWVFWNLVRAIVETVILDSDFPDHTVDASMVRLSGQLIGLFGSVIILAYGAQKLGAPVVSLLTGLGIGGLAVALAARPTLENLIGGFALFLDKPVRVGDYCTFGDQDGTVESIGARSTQVRALDRTLITIPNAQFADLQIINWAQVDEMLIRTTIGLRYETDTEQMRHVLAKIREMLHSHPRINPATVRVRFIGHGDSSLDIEIRVYAKTREWNDFFAIREDVLFRVSDVVTESGSSFAFPSQTIYLGRDKPLDETKTAAAHKEVEMWRRSRKLPFPRFDAGRIAQLQDTIKYPPPGSSNFSATAEELAEGGETLSAAPALDPTEESSADSDTKPDNK